jgi:DNA-binding PadR family transcriptional regulator
VPDPRSLLPLRPVDFVLLLALADGERHGYGLVSDIERRTDGAVRLAPGNLYRILRRMMDDGLVDESGRRPAADLDDERRRYYRLTALGARVARLEAQRLRALLATPAARALIRPPEPA